MVDNTSVMPEQVALFARSPTDPVWSERLTSDDEVTELGATFVVNGLVTPTRIAVTSLVAPSAVAGAGARLAALTVGADDGMLVSKRSGNPACPAYWDVGDLGQAIGLNLGGLPHEYSRWRYSTELYVMHGGAAYLVLGDMAVRHRVLSGDELALLFVQRLLPFLTQRPDELTGSMVVLVSVPSRLAALGGLRGYRRALLEAGAAASWLSQQALDDTAPWMWETEFYDDVAGRLLGVDGVERVVTHIGYQTWAVPESVERALTAAETAGSTELTEGSQT